MKEVLMQQYPQGGMGGRLNRNDPPSSQANLVGERGIAYSNPNDGGYNFNPNMPYANPITGFQENLSAQSLMNSLINDTAPPLTNPVPNQFGGALTAQEMDSLNNYSSVMPNQFGGALTPEEMAKIRKRF